MGDRKATERKEIVVVVFEKPNETERPEQSSRCKSGRKRKHTFFPALFYLQFAQHESYKQSRCLSLPVSQPHIRCIHILSRFISADLFLDSLDGWMILCLKRNYYT